MKISKYTFFLIILSILFASGLHAAARPDSQKGIYSCSALTGGAQGALDSLDQTGDGDSDITDGTPNRYDLIEGDAALVGIISGTTVNYYFYIYDADGTDAENSPIVIRPDDYSTSGVWRLTPTVDREPYCVSASDETTDLTTGTAKITFRMPHAMVLTALRASVGTAPVGSTIIVDVNEGGTTILSTKLTIDAGEKTSETAATEEVISDSSLANDAEMTIDIDQVGSTTAGKGLKVCFDGWGIF